MSMEEVGTGRPDVVALRGLPRRFSLWLAVEGAALGVSGLMGWDGVPQPWLALGLVARGLGLLGFLAALGGVDGARARRPQALGLVALALLPWYALGLVPPVFTEAGWDAVLSLVLAPMLALVVATATDGLSPVARRVAGRLAAARLAGTPLVAALSVVAIMPALGPDMAPSPWLAPAAWAVLWLVVVRLGTLTRGAAVVAVLLASATLTGLFDLAEDPVSGRTFSAAFGLLALGLVGRHVSEALSSLARAAEAHHETLLDARQRRVAETLAEATAQGREMTEDEALALVDRELGFAAPAVPYVSPANGPVRAIAPLELVRTSQPQVPPERWAERAGAIGRLRRWVLVATLGLVFGGLIGQTPLGALPVAVATAALSAALVAGVLAHTSWRLAEVLDVGPVRAPWRAAGWSAGLAAAFCLAAALPDLGLAPASWFGATARASATALTLAWLAMVRAGLERLMVRRPPAAVGRLGGLIAGLCLFAALRVTHAAFAPGDMSWLSAPLIVATAVLLLALAHGLLWTFHALEQDLHDRETKALQAAGIPSPRQTSRGASEA